MKCNHSSSWMPNFFGLPLTVQIAMRSKITFHERQNVSLFFISIVLV